MVEDSIQYLLRLHMDTTEACHYSTDNNTSKHTDGILLHIIHGLESLYNPTTEANVGDEDVEEGLEALG